MAEIINLNKARKQKAKVDKKARTEENRRHGLTKGQKLKNKAEQDSVTSKLDGLRLYRPEKDGDKDH
ncbi:MAG: DUF4169 family protein [Rhodospirillales bacterium]|nr:DUF4169 family protein [Rhodospirillales bacterium]